MIDFLDRLAAAGHPADAPRSVAGGGRSCRHHLSHSRHRPGAGLAAVFSGAVAMGAGDPGLDAAFHGRDPGRTLFGRCRLARRPRRQPQLSGDVPGADRPNRAHGPVRRSSKSAAAPARWCGCLARRLGGANPITAADVNPFLLREAVALADGRGSRRGNSVSPMATPRHCLSRTIRSIAFIRSRCSRNVMRIVRSPRSAACCGRAGAPASRCARST